MGLKKYIVLLLMISPERSIPLPPGKKIYFLSDFHLGVPDAASSLQREKYIVSFLDSIQSDAGAIFLLGDLFDFWYEYRTVVPRGFVRILGKIASLSDAGIPIHFFVGNHDMWMRNYFQQELQVPVYFEPQAFRLGSKDFLIGHGDGLGPGDHGYKAMKKVFRNPLCQWLFGILPPAVGVGTANYFSRKSRAGDKAAEETFLGEDREWLIIYSKAVLQEKNFHFFVFGHRHLPIDFRLSKDSRYINLGDWIRYFTYAVFDGEEMQLKSFGGNESKIYRNW